ncbi:MAG: hypothetical protein JW896_11535 [Deltaproteobacteria bacterium]|nr:hypothetical protein [Deltaproteobacteria bacterium]
MASLPFEPAIVEGGDIGSVTTLDNDQLSFTHEFNKMVDQIVGLTT